MRSRQQLAVIAVALLVCLGISLSAQTDKESEIKSFADSIYKLWDEGKYAEMYQRFHSSMKAQATEAQWVSTAKDVAQKTGKNLERRFKVMEPAFGARVVRYESRYEGGRANDEIYVIEENGRLTISGIWVKPAY
jgi:hypothetical protein